MKCMAFIGFKTAILLLVSYLVFPDASLGKRDPELFSKIKPRCIGPANMSGRIGDIDVVITNPRNSAGVGRGTFKSIDARKTWTFWGLEKTERISRIALDPYDANVVYVAAMGTTWGEDPERGVFKTEDGGFTWKTVNDQPGVSGRPFYYSDIRVNPQNENIVYVLESRLKVSEDGGKNFTNFTERGQAHSDFQAMWIHPDGEFMVVGNDGGIVFTVDRGKSWRFARNLPLGQFYHISYDMELPYNVYGGLQDNGSWRSPSAVLTDWGIFNYHWRSVGGGDGFDSEPDPENSYCEYAMSQGRRGLYVLPGTYTVRLPYGDMQLTHPIQVKPDPRYKMDMEVLKKNYDLSHKVGVMMMKVFGVLREIRQMQKSIKTVTELVKDADIKNKKELIAEAKALNEKLKALSEKVRPDSDRQGISDRSTSLSSKIFRLSREVVDNFEPLTQAVEEQLKKTKAFVEAFFSEYNKLFQTEVEGFKKHITDSGVSLFKPFKPLSLN